ncbi:MAG: TolC family outer membrane protein [Acetobacteraceae bacterium]
MLAIGVAALASGAARAQPRTLPDALVAAYSNNPTLQAARAQLRATDEGVPQALAGWRPTIVLSTGAGYADGTIRNATGALGASTRRNARDIFSEQATLTQPLYRGGATRAGTNQADNRVYAQRARLMATEQQVFTDTVNAYVNVIQTQQVLQLNINNEQVLARQLQATNDRFRVGEITRTDVAQAEAALAGARGTRQTAEGNLQTARGAYRRYVGELPDVLIEPQPVRLPIKTQNEAVQLASQNNPNVIAALFDDAASRDAIDVAFSNLMPQVSLQASAARADNSAVAGQRTIGGQVLLNASVPIYQGGAEYSRVRQARQTEQQSRKTVDDTRRQVIQQATAAWETLVAARSTIESTRAQIRANQIALEGVQREAIVGSRTTLDVLNAEQALLNSRVTLVQNLASLINASYSAAASIGRLTARDLNLNVPLYDETAYYNAVRDRLFGTGDYAVNQPGR